MIAWAVFSSSMKFFVIKPYSPKIRGELEEYLREHDGSNVSNLFFGPKYFFIIRDKGLMIPELSLVRVSQSPAPDIAFFVNSDYLLEGYGSGEYNMSCIRASKGIYEPGKVLRRKCWSISGLNFR